jgi:hypothetical protein
LRIALIAVALLLPVTVWAAPLCLPAATAAALQHLGLAADATAIAREVPVHADGVDLFDQRLWLQRRGVEALVVRPDDLPAWLERGHPVVVVRGAVGERHAVALWRAATGTVTEVDDRAVGPVQRPQALAVAGSHAGIVILRLGALWPDGDFKQRDAAFVASGWLRRAREVEPGTEARAYLLVQALLARPCAPDVRQELAATVLRLRPTVSLRMLLATVPACRGR